MTTAPKTTEEIIGLLDGLDGLGRRLILEVINGLSHNRISCEEVEAAEIRIRSGADKFDVLEKLVDLSNLRLCESLLNGEVTA